MRRVLAGGLLVLCGAGILVGFVPGELLWHGFEFLVFGLLGTWLAGWAAGLWEGRWNWRLIPLLGILAIGGLQLWRGWTEYRFATVDDLLRWGAFLAVFFLAIQLFDSAESTVAFRKLFIVYALILCVVSLLQRFAGNGKIFWLFPVDPGIADWVRMGPFLNYDHYASFIALALPVGLYEMAKSTRQRWVYAVLSATLYASVVASGSRAGFLLNTAEIFLVVVLVGFNKRSILLEAGLLVVFSAVVGWGFLFQRFQQEDPYAGRREIAAATVEMVRANPWHGYGLGTWTEVYSAFAKKDLGVFINAAHNDWLQWGADGGVPMVVCVLALFAGSMVLLRKAPWAMGVPIVLVHGLIDFPMQGRFLPSVVFLLFGIASAAGNRRSILSRDREGRPPASRYATIVRLPTGGPES
jgi:hypothetical protein